MTDRRDDPNTRDESEEGLAQLLRFAGRRDPVPEDRAERVKGHVAARWRGAVRRRRWQRRGLLALSGLGAAAGLVVALVSWRHSSVEAPVVARLERTEGAVWFTRRAAGEGTQVIRAQTGIETGASGRAALRLNGGASIRLDVLSRARLISDSELELERGAVYVDTGGASDGGALRVHTPLGVAQDIGTQFELRVTGPGVRLRVREGTVNMDGTGPTVTAHSGEELRLAPGGTVTRDVVPRHGPAWVWTQAIAAPFVLEGRSLRAFLEWYARETQFEVSTRHLPSGVDVDDISVHGTIEGLTPEEALDAVLATCGLSYRRAGSAVILEGGSAPRPAQGRRP